MDSREFDDLIKNSLDGFSQLPEKEVKKAIFGKVFYQNLWVFHKVKLFCSLLVLGLVVAYSYQYLNGSNSNENKPFDAVGNLNNAFVKNTNVAKNSTLNDESLDDELVANKAVELSNVDEINKVEDLTINADFNESVMEQNTTYENRLSLENQKSESLIDEDKRDVKPNDKSQKLIENVGFANADINELSPQKEFKNQSTAKDKSIASKNNLKSNIDDQVNSLNIVAIHSCFPVHEIKDVLTPDLSDYANEHKRGFTFDAYFSPFNNVNIDNTIDPVHNDYWWDFYKEHDMMYSGLGGGFNVSYNYRNFKLNSGFNFDQVHDFKPQYEYFTDYDSIYGIQNGNIVLLNVELISGLQVFGPTDSSGYNPIINTDTTVVFYVDPNDENLSKEIQQSANRYNYLRIPLTLGYEFSFKRASFELNAGLEYTRLMRANGISYKDGYVDVGIRTVPYYYYEDMVATTFQNNMSSIKVNNWNYVANAIARIRMTRSLDLFTSVRFQYNTNNIMGDDYVLQKSYKKYGFNIGVTYHLNKRMSLKEMIAPSWD